MKKQETSKDWLTVFRWLLWIVLVLLLCQGIIKMVSRI